MQAVVDSTAVSFMLCQINSSCFELVKICREAFTKPTVTYSSLACDQNMSVGQGHGEEQLHIPERSRYTCRRHYA